MDPSAFIFVALAVAWAVYLVPKALKQHDEVRRSRSVDRFSHTMRVLARREPVNRRDARLVVTPGRPARRSWCRGRAAAAARPHVTHRRRRRATVVQASWPTPASARRAARRRLRVLSAILVATLSWWGSPYLRFFGWVWSAIPVALLVAWLVACRLMVKRERAVVLARPRLAPYAPIRGLRGRRRGAPSHRVETLAETSVAVPRRDAFQATPPETRPRHAGDPALDPVPVTLPTYVTKPVATRRTVQHHRPRRRPASGPPVATDRRRARPRGPAADRARAHPPRRGLGPPRRRFLTHRPVDRYWEGPRIVVLTFPTASPCDALGLWRSW